MSKDKTVYICPLCNVPCTYQHIVDIHKEFWENRFLVDVFPSNAEEFNKRFSPIGLTLRKQKGNTNG